MVINEEGKRPVIVDLMNKLKLISYADQKQSAATNPVFRYGKIKYTDGSNKMVNLFECNEVRITFF